MTDTGEGQGSRRTVMAGERTTLAWVRTGLTVVAVAVGVGTIAPQLGDSNPTAYALVGAAYALLGVGVVVYGVLRGRAVDAAIRHGRPVPLNDRAMLLIGGLSAALGLATAALIALEV